jgi:hypothetical protein
MFHSDQIFRKRFSWLGFFLDLSSSSAFDSAKGESCKQAAFKTFHSELIFKVDIQFVLIHAVFVIIALENQKDVAKFDEKKKCKERINVLFTYFASD